MEIVKIEEGISGQMAADTIYSNDVTTRKKANLAGDIPAQYDNIIPELASLTDTGSAWQKSTTTGLEVDVDGLHFIKDTGLVNKIFVLTGVLEIGKSYKIRLRASTDVNGVFLAVGSQATSNESAAVRRVTLSGADTLYEIAITADSVDLYVSFTQPVQPQADIKVSNIYVLQPNALGETINYVQPPVNILNENNSNFNLPNDWAQLLDTGNSDMVKNNGNITINAAGGNLAVNLPNSLEIGKTYRITLKVNSSVQGLQVHLGGAFTSTPTASEEKVFTLNAGANTIEGDFTITRFGYIVFGVINQTGTLIFDEISAVELSGLYEELESIKNQLGTIPEYGFNLDNCLSASSRYEKAYLTWVYDGDSLNANPTGGAVPPEFAEGAFMYPLMLSVNSLARRTYDLLGWNKAQFRNLAFAGWAKTGTWIDDKAAVLNRPQTLDAYMRASTGATASINLPVGTQHFAIFCRKTTTAGVSISVKVGSAAAQVVNLTASYNTSFHIEPFLNANITAGNETVLITVTGTAHIHSIAFWNGNTQFIQNVARGGHTLADLQPFFNGDVIQNKPDAVIFQLTEMNNLREPLQKSVADLQYYIDALKNIDHVFTSCHPLGTNPVDTSVNFYANYQDPTQEQLNDALMKALYEAGEPALNIFNSFRQKVLNRGGTLQGGQAGLWYTHDGQHQSPEGMREYFNILRRLFIGIPLLY